MGLKLLNRGPLEWHHIPTKFHEIYQATRKLLEGELTDRHSLQTRDLISLLSFLESRLKYEEKLLSIRQEQRN
jgi:hypothetical protein